MPGARLSTYTIDGIIAGLGRSIFSHLRAHGRSRVRPRRGRPQPFRPSDPLRFVAERPRRPVRRPRNVEYSVAPFWRAIS
jgi:hypothetical protein